MSWVERSLYFLLMFGLYCAGRWQTENRELLHRALNAKEIGQALKENRIGDIQYKLQNDINVCLYNSYTAYSFGPDLWQKPLPKEKITFTFEAPKAPQPHPRTQAAPEQATPQQQTPEPAPAAPATIPPEETAPISDPQ